jgi:hypothetical protein
VHAGKMQGELRTAQRHAEERPWPPD